MIIIDMVDIVQYIFSNSRYDSKFKLILFYFISKCIMIEYIFILNFLHIVLLLLLLCNILFIWIGYIFER